MNVVFDKQGPSQLWAIRMTRNLPVTQIFLTRFDRLSFSYLPSSSHLSSSTTHPSLTYVFTLASPPTLILTPGVECINPCGEAVAISIQLQLQCQPSGLAIPSFGASWALRLCLANAPSLLIDCRSFIRHPANHSSLATLPNSGFDDPDFIVDSIPDGHCLYSAPAALGVETLM